MCRDSFPKGWDLADEVPAGVDLRVLLDGVKAYEGGDDDESNKTHVDERGKPCKGVPDNMRLAISLLDVTLRHNEFADQNIFTGYATLRR